MIKVSLSWPSPPLYLTFFTIIKQIPRNKIPPMTLKRMIVISFHSGNGALPFSNILIFSKLKSLIRSMYMIWVSSSSVVITLRFRWREAFTRSPFYSTTTTPILGFYSSSDEFTVKLKSNRCGLSSARGKAPINPLF